MAIVLTVCFEFRNLKDILSIQHNPTSAYMCDFWFLFSTKLTPLCGVYWNEVIKTSHGGLSCKCDHDKSPAKTVLKQPSEVPSRQYL